MIRRGFIVLGATSIALLVACGGGGGGGPTVGLGSHNTDGGSTGGSNTGSQPPAGESPTSLTGEVGDLPVVGQFLASCLDTGVALIDGFASAASSAAGVPTPVSEVLALGDPDAIPVIGGLVPSGLLGGGLVPIDLDEALSQIPVGGLDANLPVLGLAPVNCSDVPTVISDLPAPTDAIALVPVFDANGDPIALILATVGEATSSAPAATDLTLPSDVQTLPQTLSSAVSSLLSGLL